VNTRQWEERDVSVLLSENPQDKIEASTVGTLQGIPSRRSTPRIDQNLTPEGFTWQISRNVSRSLKIGLDRRGSLSWSGDPATKRDWLGHLFASSGSRTSGSSAVPLRSPVVPVALVATFDVIDVKSAPSKYWAFLSRLCDRAWT